MKISIITVVYNGKKTIEQTINSVLGQTYDDIEYIIIDGDSTDGTQEIVRSFGNKIACFISEKDNGLYDAMNKGIRHSNGEIIGIINSDDWYVADAIDNIVKAFEETDADVVYGGMEIVHKGGYCSKLKNGKLEDILFRMTIPHPTAFVKRSVYERIGLFDLQYKIVADYDLFLRMYLSGIHLYQIPKTIAYFRDGGISSTNAVECAAEVRKVATYYAEKRGNIEALVKIEENYKLRLKDAQVHEKVQAIINCRTTDMKHYFKEKMNGKEKISIFGAGSRGLECYFFLKDIGLEIDCFLDNNEEIRNTIFIDKPVRQLNIEIKKENYVIVAVLNYQDEIVKQLEDYGVRKGKGFSLFYTIVDELYQYCLGYEVL